MKKYFVFLFFLVSFVSASIPDYSNYYVNDYGNVLTSEQEAYLENIYYLVEQNSSVEIVFVSVDSCLPLTPNEYATQIGEKWGVGKEDADNGLVLLFCVNETKFYAATGYGLEGILPDSKLGRFLDDYYVPFRNLGNYSAGIISFSEVVANEIVLNSEEFTSGNNVFIRPTFSWFYFFIYLGLLILFVVVIQFLSILKYIFSVIFIILGVVLLPSFFGMVLIVLGIAFLIPGGKNNPAGIFSGGSFGGYSGGGGFGGGSFGGGGAGR